MQYIIKSLKSKEDMDMSWWQKIKMSFTRMMAGRYGADELGQAILWGGIALSLLELFTGSLILGMVSMALFIWAIFRMLSRNRAARSAENTKFLYQWGRVRRSVSQFFSRVKHAKEYKYFTCPQCKAKLRIPRKVGNVTVTCKKCQNRFDIKA